MLQHSNTPPETDRKQPDRKLGKTQSKDGQRRSFPKIPCLLQYVSNGNYYGRIRVSGKLIRVSPKDHRLDDSQAETD